MCFITQEVEDITQELPDIARVLLDISPELHDVAQGVLGRSKVDLLMDLGSHLEGSGHRFLTKIMLWTVTFPYMLSEGCLGAFCVGLWSSRETLEPEKQCKTIVLSSKIKVCLKSMRSRIRRSPGSFFHEFGVALGGLGGLLGILGASFLEVGF